MIGAIIGDVVGSRYEFNKGKKPSYGFQLITEESKFTDDTILTIALMDWALHSKIKDSYSVIKYLQKWGRKYPGSYGGRFSSWLWDDDPKPYQSKGNGSGMRISPIAYMAHNREELMLLSDIATSVTHDSYNGLKGARAIAYATYMALHGYPKEEIRQMAVSFYQEIEHFTYEDLVKNYKFNELSENTCPQALYCFLISNSFEDCLRISISVGGDSDTLAAMSCSIAEAYYKDVPSKLVEQVRRKLPLEMLEIIDEFQNKFEKTYKKRGGD